MAPSGAGDGIAVRIVGRPSQHLVDALDEAFGHDVLELFGFLVHFGPAHAHDLDQKRLDQTVTPQHEARQLLARLRQPHARVRLVLGQPRLGQCLHHRRGRAGRDADAAATWPIGSSRWPGGSVD